MTGVNETLITAIESSNMLIIDGLHAWDFSLEDAGLRIECMDGRAAKQWRFSPEQVLAATFDATLQSWVLKGDESEHRLECLSAISGSNDGEPECANDEG